MSTANCLTSHRRDFQRSPYGCDNSDQSQVPCIFHLRSCQFCTGKRMSSCVRYSNLSSRQQLLCSMTQSSCDGIESLRQLLRQYRQLWCSASVHPPMRIRQTWSWSHTLMLHQPLGCFSLKRYTIRSRKNAWWSLAASRPPSNTSHNQSDHQARDHHIIVLDMRFRHRGPIAWPGRPGLWNRFAVWVGAVKTSLPLNELFS